MYRMLGGIIYSVATSKVFSLNFYPILGELGTVATRLSKICRWSPKLFELIKNNAKSVQQYYNRPEEITAWLRTVKDKTQGGNLRLFVHPFVTVPHGIYDVTQQEQER